MNLNLDFQVACSEANLPAAIDVKRWVEAAVREEREAAELSIRVVSAEESRQLNHQYRNQDKPTNVLSFTADLPLAVDIPLLGDIVVCAPVVAREAREQQKSLEAHWAHMIVHGTLHLLGYDHIEDRDAVVMENLETAILTGLKYPAPYTEQSIN